MIEQFEQIVKSLMAQIDKLEDKINKATEILKKYGNGSFDEEVLKILGDKE